MTAFQIRAGVSRKPRKAGPHRSSLSSQSASLTLSFTVSLEMHNSFFFFYIEYMFIAIFPLFPHASGGAEQGHVARSHLAQVPVCALISAW